MYIKMTPCINLCKEVATEVDEDCWAVGKASKSAGFEIKSNKEVVYFHLEKDSIKNA